MNASFRRQSKKTNGLTLNPKTEIEEKVKGFLLDRRAKNVTKGTMYFYFMKTQAFLNYCAENRISWIDEITPVFIREFLLFLKETDHNEGGVFAFYRVLKTFLLWYEDEFEPEHWKNPIRKVSAPKTSIEPLEGVSKEDVYLMVDQCEKNTFFGERDKAILLTLLETGVRASELIDINLEDVDFIESSILIRQGKGRKPRTVFFGKTARKQLRTYLKFRGNSKGALFSTKQSERLTYTGLREIVRRLAKRAKIQEPGLHDFRRTFAIECLRRKIDIQTIARLMGHSSLQVITRYLRQTKGDLGSAYKSIIDSDE